MRAATSRLAHFTPHPATAAGILVDLAPGRSPGPACRPGALQLEDANRARRRPQSCLVDENWRKNRGFRLATSGHRAEAFPFLAIAIHRQEPKSGHRLNGTALEWGGGKLLALRANRQDLSRCLPACGSQRPGSRAADIRSSSPAANVSSPRPRNCRMERPVVDLQSNGLRVCRDVDAES